MKKTATLIKDQTTEQKDVRTDAEIVRLFSLYDGKHGIRILGCTREYDVKGGYKSDKLDFAFDSDEALLWFVSIVQKGFTAVLKNSGKAPLFYDEYCGIEYFVDENKLRIDIPEKYRKDMRAVFYYPYAS